MTNKNYTYFILPFILISLLAYFFNKERTKEKHYKFVKVEKKSFNLTISQRGELEASRMIHIKSKISSNKAKIIELVKEGTDVKKGEIIGRFDTQPFNDNLTKWSYKLSDGETKLIKVQKEVEIHKNQIKADKESLTKAIEIAKMNLNDIKFGSGLIKLQEYKQKIKKEKRDLTLIKLELKDQLKLQKQGFTSQKEIQKIQNQLLNAQENLATSQAYFSNYEKYILPKTISEKEIAYQQSKEKIKTKEVQNQFKLESKKAAVKNVQNTLAYYFKEFQKAKKNIALCDIRSPIDGILLYNDIPKNGKRAKIEIGDSIWQNQTFIKIPDTQYMIVKTKIKEIDIRHIQKGLDVEVVLDAYPKQIFYGSVNKIDSLAKSDENNKNIKYFDISIKLNNIDDNLKSGMSAKVSINYDKADNVLVVPPSAIFYEDKNVYVLVKYFDKVKKQYIKIGKISYMYIEVLSGLKKGDLVAIR